MKQIEKGDLDNLEEQSLGVVSQTAQDEVSQLNRTFKMMIRRIRELIDENYAKQLIIRETELKALQAQINPHFLYNTLESINWLAKMNKQAKISEMVEALGYLFRSSIGLKDPLITLEKRSLSCAIMSLSRKHGLMRGLISGWMYLNICMTL